MLYFKVKLCSSQTRCTCNHIEKYATRGSTEKESAKCQTSRCFNSTGERTSSSVPLRVAHRYAIILCPSERGCSLYPYLYPLNWLPELHLRWWHRLLKNYSVLFCLCWSLHKESDVICTVTMKRVSRSTPEGNTRRKEELLKKMLFLFPSFSAFHCLTATVLTAKFNLVKWGGIFFVTQI